MISDDDELEGLLKNKLRSCVHCKGVGYNVLMGGELTQCFKCDGEGVYCAWCYKLEKYCECR